MRTNWLLPQMHILLTSHPSKLQAGIRCNVPCRGTAISVMAESNQTQAAEEQMTSTGQPLWCLIILNPLTFDDFIAAQSD